MSAQPIQSVHLINMAHFNAVARAKNVVPEYGLAVWSRQIPSNLPEGMANPYPCFVAYLMTPLDDAIEMDNSTEIPSHSRTLYIVECHSEISLEDADGRSERFMRALNESEGNYDGGDVEQCLMRRLSSDLIDNRRGGQPVYRIGYVYELLTYRLVTLD